MKEQKRITLINQDSGYLMIDIANTFVKNGYNVTLIAGRILERNTKLNHKIKVQHINPYVRTSVLKRIYSWISGFIQIIILVKRFHKSEELLIVSNPPIAVFIPFFCRNKFNLLIFDIYIETLEKFVPLKDKSPLVYIWKKWHKSILEKSNSIFVLTKGMKSKLSAYVKSVDVQILTLWSDDSFIKPINKIENKFIAEYNLQDYFIVFYSGNLGINSGIEHIMDLAELMKSDTKFKFLIIGEGILKDKISKRINDNKLTNCLLLPRQNYEVMPYSFASADISIVSLSSKSSNNSIPSKTFNYLSSGSPILCIASQSADISEFVENHKVGKVFTPDNIDDAVVFLEQLSTNIPLIEELRMNALKTSKSLTLENANELVKCFY